MSPAIWAFKNELVTPLWNILDLIIAERRTFTAALSFPVMLGSSSLKNLAEFKKN